MKNLKTVFLTLLIVLYCSTSIHAQENSSGKLKGKVATSGDVRIASDSKDNLSNADSSANERKGWDGTVKGGKINAKFMSKKGYDYYKAQSDIAASDIKKDSVSTNSSKRAINESGVSVKSHK